MSKLHGCIAESDFETQCLKRNIPIYKPIADMYGVDYVAGRLLERVQVKSTFVCDKRYPNKPTYKVKFTRGADSRGYDGSEFELAAVYIGAINVWYIIPVEIVTAKTIRINPDNLTCKYHQYKEAWSFLNGTPEDAPPRD